MFRARKSALVALTLSFVFHVGMLAAWTVKTPPPPPPDLRVSIMEMPPPAQTDPAEARRADLARPQSAPPIQPTKKRVPDLDSSRPAPEHKPRSLAAPSPPSAEDWNLAATYTLRNSKRYRYNWGQQVRSMMGTAVEGPDQGVVRFRIEVAPDGKVANVEELWSTSALASRLALQAIQSLPPLPPTPTGQPLVFEQTISFLPYETGWPPDYRLDCLPEPAPFNNPFVWDGASPPPAPQARGHRPPIPEDCVIDSTAETIEEEERSMTRQMDQWRWAR